MTNGRLAVAAVLVLGAGGLACEASTPLDPNVDGGSANDVGSGAVATGGVSATGGTGAGSGGAGSGGAVGRGGSGGSGGTSSSSIPGQSVSGTVAASIMVGPATDACQQSLRLTNPAQPMSGFLIMAPAAYQNDRRAGDPSYVYLDAGKDAVSLPGPTVIYGDAAFEAASATITTCVNAESACAGQDGYRIEVTPQLTFVITIDDWEDEIALGQIELCMNAGTLTTQFVFAGIGGYLGGGVAHQVSIYAIVTSGTATPATSPVTIECR